MILKDSKMMDVIQISKNVLARIASMDFEKDGGNSIEHLIFPIKIQKQGTKKIDRISEQELRLLFIEEFKIANPELFYSIETPTTEKFRLGKLYEKLNPDKDGRSASLDMCIFERTLNVYNRILNIEFKHKNAIIKNIGKDVLKLLHEPVNGAFILLLNNTDKGTICNKNETGVFNKLYKSFSDFNERWSSNDKYLQLIIISLKQGTLIHRKIIKSELNKLKDIFFIESGCGNINDIKGMGWESERVGKMQMI